MLILQFKFWKVQGEGKGGGVTKEYNTERVQYIPFLKEYNIYLFLCPVSPTQCCVSGTSYMNDKNCSPKCSQISTQHWKCEEGYWFQSFCDWLSQKKYIKVFLWQFWLLTAWGSVFWSSFMKSYEKRFSKWKWKLLKFLAPKLTIFLIFRNYQLFCIGVSTS